MYSRTFDRRHSIAKRWSDKTVNGIRNVTKFSRLDCWPAGRHRCTTNIRKPISQWEATRSKVKWNASISVLNEVLRRDRTFRRNGTIRAWKYVLLLSTWFIPRFAFHEQRSLNLKSRSLPANTNPHYLTCNLRCFNLSLVRTYANTLSLNIVSLTLPSVSETTIVESRRFSRDPGTIRQAPEQGCAWNSDRLRYPSGLPSNFSQFRVANERYRSIKRNQKCYAYLDDRHAQRRYRREFMEASDLSSSCTYSNYSSSSRGASLFNPNEANAKQNEFKRSTFMSRMAVWIRSFHSRSVAFQAAQLSTPFHFFVSSSDTHTHVCRFFFLLFLETPRSEQKRNFLPSHGQIDECRVFRYSICPAHFVRLSFHFDRTLSESRYRGQVFQPARGRVFSLVRIRATPI